MNIVQMHLGVKARLDQVSTPRFKDSQIDNSINTVSSFIVKNKVAGIVENGQRLSFQKTQIIRDELYSIVKEDDTDGNLTVSNDKIIQALPSDYRYLLGLEIQINSVAKDWCAAITYDELFALKKDPYQRPSQDFPYIFYYIESNTGLEVFYDKNIGDSLNYARILYLANPLTVLLGDKFTSGTSFTGSAIAYTDCTYDSATVRAGTAFTIATANLFTAGTAVKNFVSSDLPPSLHDDIVFDAATALNSDIDNFDKWKVMREDKLIRNK